MASLRSHASMSRKPPACSWVSSERTICHRRVSSAHTNRLRGLQRVSGLKAVAALRHVCVILKERSSRSCTVLPDMASGLCSCRMTSARHLTDPPLLERAPFPYRRSGVSELDSVQVSFLRWGFSPPEHLGAL
jgi:hypothetical protein